MAKIKANKSEAARRQIDFAIRTLFSGEDPLAIHTVVSAALRILRDLCSKRTDSYMTKETQKIIRPRQEKEFWKAWHAPSNFLKHADKDSEAILENIEEEVNDGVLVIAILYYVDMGHQLTPEMVALLSWFFAIHPDLISENAPAMIKDIATDVGTGWRSMSRQEQLAKGAQVLEMARNSAKTFRKMKA